MEAVLIAAAFVTGLATQRLGLPPLIGYLAAGLALNGISQRVDWLDIDVDALAHIAHLGVLLMLFTIGLKLRLRNVLQPEVIGTGVIQLLFTGLLFAPAFYLLLGLPWPTAALLATALSFSSTVVAAKVLEAKREMRAFHGRVAIGILIIQDLLALVVLSLVSDHAPSPYALALFALPLLRPLLYRLLDTSGHGELLVLFGLLLAVTLGGIGFEALGLSGELGALVMGALLAEHRRAGELAYALWNLKDVLLVGFFFTIGMAGLPDRDGVIIALLLVALLPLKVLLYFAILVLFRLRARSAFLASLSLASYSEFGLIVASYALTEWLSVLALAVAASFLVAAPLNRYAHALYTRWEPALQRFELNRRHPDEQPVSLGLANVVILGMGRTGAAAYDALRARDERVVGLDADPGRVEANLTAGRRVLYADAEDPGFWHALNTEHLDAVLLTMNDADACLSAVRQLRALNFGGAIVASSLYDDDARAIIDAGADRAFLTYSEAGVGLATHAWQALHDPDAYRSQPMPETTATAATTAAKS